MSHYWSPNWGKWSPGGHPTKANYPHLSVFFSSLLPIQPGQKNPAVHWAGLQSDPKAYTASDGRHAGRWPADLELTQPTTPTAAAPPRPGHPPRSHPGYRAAATTAPGDGPLDVGISQEGCRHEHRRNPFFTTGIHPIQHQHMEVRMQIQRAAEALDKGHRSTTDIGVSLCPNLLAIPGLDRAEKHCQKTPMSRPSYAAAAPPPPVLHSRGVAFFG